MSSPEEPSARSATDVFSLLGDETRLSVLRVLADDLRENGDEAGLSFARLRKRVGVEDAGKFNYHLGELRGQFVEKDEGQYELRRAGALIVAAILAGTYTERGRTLSAEVDSTCPMCDDSLTASFEDAQVRLVCGNHGLVFQVPLPPGAATDRGTAELLALAHRRTQWNIEQATAGVCPFCWGEIEVTVPASGSTDDEQLLVTYGCERCWFTSEVPVGACVVRHPAVVSLYHDYGIDIRECSYTDLDFLGGSSSTLLSEDPARVAVTVELDDDALRLTLDESLTVVGVERTGDA